MLPPFFRWFTLRDNALRHYDTDEENAKCRGTIELKTIVDVTDVTEKENGIDIILVSGRIFSLSAENAEEAHEWYR